ncbi:ATP-dependent Clp protease proteolytic subunit [Bradyrhizobium sp. AUGA SZCCT0169]|uniref:ATP-dependent Clp protease proteolytic subunit n=1 Tax=Bradyrhizobium sp. AUGA SZCCT0169 TaxID=2807663 RepID=UPI001BAD8EFB|nr:ATP-dependent Clp protease proteolytic subunit [Bradyrhizobium sp. AUGA SZCCT0169]MBR1246141.1 ATP-dependent Clp protease proteolytic subunit [Bradyrhizobium sp. AUGA SZCCT0169]
MNDAPEMICMIQAGPRIRPKPLPDFPSPAQRPEGAGQPLVLEFFSEVPRGIDIALGKVPTRDTAAFLNAIRTAGNRSVVCKINCAGGEAESALAIAQALLRHPFAVHCKIIGRCSSAAAFIALAADTRTIVPDGYVLLHTARRICTPEQWENIQRLAPLLKQPINEGLADIDDATAVLLRSRLVGVSEVQARAWLEEDRKWPAQEALERGFVNRVESP